MIKNHVFSRPGAGSDTKYLWSKLIFICLIINLDLLMLHAMINGKLNFDKQL